MEALRTFINNITQASATEMATNLPDFLLPLSITISRYLLPLLAVVVVVRCSISLLRGKSEPETWAWLGLGDGVRLPVHHWENTIGRSHSADIILPMPQVSRTHAALIRSAYGNWQLIDIAKKDNLYVNGQPVEDVCDLSEGDVIRVAGNELVLAQITKEEDKIHRAKRTIPGKQIKPSKTLLWLSLFMIILAGQLAIAQAGTYSTAIIFSFGWLIALMWISWLIIRSFRKRGFEIETFAFFLSSIGLAVIASADPGELFKQSLAITIGLLGFFILGWILRDMKKIKALRWPAAFLAIVFLGLVFLFGEEINGAQNWIIIGNFSLQLSELVKILFIFAGAATLERLFVRRNIYAFVALSAIIVGSLALMNDFGTALIFFTVYLIIAYLRSGDLATVILSLSGAALAVILVLSAKPYVAERFSTWGHAWEYAATGGYQQTRAMSAMGSGGFFGLGGGEGWLKEVAAADTDLVFAFIGEEWGLIISLAALAALIIMALFAVRAASTARSSYFVIAASATAGLLLVQTMLNVGGSLDLLPLTGVTFPFASNGGTSMIASWCLLAFLKAADTRQNASFAIRQPLRKAKDGIAEDIDE